MQSRPNPRTWLVAAALAATCAVLALAPAAQAIVPPSDCGRMTVKAKRYNIKADQLRCTTARTYAARYLSSHRKPAGFTCRDFGSETKLKFRCSKGIQVFFAIRR
jgi:hypothetical protein